MEQARLQPMVKTAAPTVAVRAARLFFLDHLRAALVILVVLHHIAVIYGASALFYYVEPPFNDPVASMGFLVFVLFNQAWFMGALFLISGYFTPGSFDRKGSSSFLGGRLLRLGVPLLVFTFVLAPISALGFWRMPASITGITSPPTWQAYPSLIGLGPMWFVALLLVFDVGYTIWRGLTAKRAPATSHESSPPGYLGLGLFIVVLALASYLVRLVIPLGKDVLGFPTLAYLPEYLSFFIVGIIALRRNWFRTLPGSMGVVGFVVAVVASVVLFPLALSDIATAQPAGFVGNGTWQSAVYALWDSLFAVGMTLAALVFFRRFLNKESRFGTFLSQQSYAVYVIHTPIIVYLAIALQRVDLRPLVKFGLMSVIAIPLCFVLAYLIRKIPGVSRIL